MKLDILYSPPFQIDGTWKTFSSGSFLASIFVTFKDNHGGSLLKKNTLPEANIISENGWLEDNPLFLGSKRLIFKGGRLLVFSGGFVRFIFQERMFGVFLAKSVEVG